MKPLRVLFVALVAVAAGAGLASGHGRPALTLNAHFVRFGDRAPQTSGDYAFLPGEGDGPGWLRDDNTGKVWTVPGPSGCGPDWSSTVIGRGGLLANCGSAFARYRLPTGTWQTIPNDSDCTNGGPGNATCVPAGIGSRWIELRTTIEGETCCGYVYQDLATGFTRAGITPVAGNIDLSRPDLTPVLCRTFKARASQIWALEDGFALLAMARPNYESALAVDRCGWKRPRVVGTTVGGVAATPGFFIWQSADQRHLRGILLPSARSFVEPLPAGMFGSPQATDTHLYIQSTFGATASWVGTAPRTR